MYREGGFVALVLEFSPSRDVFALRRSYRPPDTRRPYRPPGLFSLPVFVHVQGGRILGRAEQSRLSAGRAGANTPCLMRTSTDRKRCRFAGWWLRRKLR